MNPLLKREERESRRVMSKANGTSDKVPLMIPPEIATAENSQVSNSDTDSITKQVLDSDSKYHNVSLITKF